MLALLAATQAHAAVGIGFIEKRQDGDVYLYTSEKIDARTSVRFKFGTSKDTPCCRALHGRDFQKMQATDFVMGDKEALSYKLIAPNAKKSGARIIGVAVIDATAASNRNDGVRAFAGKQSYVATTCLGTEGVNLRLFRDGVLVDSLYYYLGYDVVPTCPDR